MNKSIPELLGEHPLFGELDPRLLDLMAGCAQNVHFAPDTVIIREGAPADRFFVLRKGKVAIEAAIPQRGSVIIETLGPDEVLGVSWPFPPYRWTFDGKAVEETSAIAVDADCLRAKCDEDPTLGYQVFARFARLMRDRLQATRLQLLDVYGNHAG